MAATTKQHGIVSRQFINLPKKMGARTQEIKPVGAWVQPELPTDHYCDNAVHNAELEEQRLRQERQEKEERLRRFQDDVRRRVQALDKAKNEQALQKSYRAVEVERHVVNQSAFAAEKSTPRKNRCSVRTDEGLAIRHSARINTQGGIISDQDQNVDQAVPFQEQSNQVQKFTRAARRKLTSRKVITEHYIHDDLPGGVWKSGPTLDHPASRQTETSHGVSTESADSEEDLPAHEIGQLESRMVQFDASPEDTREKRINRKSATEVNGTQLDRCPAVPNIYPGVQSEEEKIRTQNQRAMYRRLFMDIERERVKENIRRRQHRKKIKEIKKSKEDERRVIEQHAQQLVEPKDPVTGETEQESFDRKVVEEQLKQKLEDSRIQQAQKNKDSTRFLEALKRNLREKIEKQNIDLPPLCCCGITVWDTNPETCANNCVFYRNPKAYARALQSLLASCDVI